MKSLSLKRRHLSCETSLAARSEERRPYSQARLRACLYEVSQISRQASQPAFLYKHCDNFMRKQGMTELGHLLWTKQQLCTSSTLFGTFLCRHCTTTTWKCLISRFIDNVNKRRRISPGRFAYVRQSWRVWIIALKFQIICKWYFRCCCCRGKA